MYLMKSRKIRIFLSGMVNVTNAQNLNCLALAHHLDKTKFEVRTLTVYSGNLSIEPIEGVSYLSVCYPAKIWHRIQLLRGILWSDIAYLCKPEYWKWQRFWLRFFRKKAFKTIEGAFVGTNLEKALALDGTIDGVRESLEFTGNTYSITQAMRAVNEQVIGVKTADKVLYLGAETKQFENEVVRETLTDVAIIGSNLFYKGLNDFFALSKAFPQLTFHVIGSGLGKVDPQAEVEQLGLKNVICHGQCAHEKLAELLKQIQLHIFPSRAEGFPKVTLETAAAGVPSLVYDDYGADEWITTGKDGFVVKTLEEMKAVVQDLLDHPERLQPLADNARAMAKRFDWSVVIKDWEREIVRIMNGD
jgi:glycosyltransferase involved in cell wall biosynthesis